MEGLAVMGFVFGMIGIVALVRVEKLIRTLKEKGILGQDYKEEWFSVQFAIITNPSIGFGKEVIYV